MNPTQGIYENGGIKATETIEQCTTSRKMQASNMFCYAEEGEENVGTGRHLKDSLPGVAKHCILRSQEKKKI